MRQFMKGEDVSSWIPPPVECNLDAYIQNFESTSRMMHQYLKIGSQPAPLSSTTVNTASAFGSGMPKSNGGAAPVGATTPTKSLAPVHGMASPQQLVAKAAASVFTAVRSGAESVLQKVGVQPKTPPPLQSKVPPQFLPPPPLAPLAPAITTTATSAQVVSSGNAGSSMMPPPAPGSPMSAIVKRERLNPEGQMVSPKGFSKRSRIEWPSDVPTNAMLKSKSRSAVAHLTTDRVRAQQTFDPDLIFAQPTSELPLTQIFAEHPKALKSISAIRGLSGDWNDDTFSLEEEMEYKAGAGYQILGPSQCSLRR